MSSDSEHTTFKMRYECDQGAFEITHADAGNDTEAYALHLYRKNRETASLGTFRSINDTILAVLRQETGDPDWDAMDPSQLPLRVHDITNWRFTE